MNLDKLRADLEAATAAPWWVHWDPSHYDTASDVKSDCGNLFASVGGTARWPEQEANARLIAQAPDLARTVLEQAAMLERMAEALDYMCRVTDHVREWHRGDTNSRVLLMVKNGCAITNEDEARAMLAAYRAQTGGDT